MKRSSTIYAGINDPVLSFVPLSADRILDIGCGSGNMGECLRKARDREVVGITYSAEEAALASERLTAVHVADLNDVDLAPLGKFDCVIMSHVLEHLFAPDEFLRRLRVVLTTDAVILVALPNVVMWRQRIQFLAGRWRYTDTGILDRTHFRFFDLCSSAELLEESGYEILKRRCDGRFPLIWPFRKFMGSWSGRVDRFTSELMPGLFALQFLYLARVKA